VPAPAVVKIEAPADARFASSLRVAVSSAVAPFSDLEVAGDVAMATGEALAVAGRTGGDSSVVIELSETLVRVTVTTSGEEDADADHEMARLVLAGLVDEFSETSGNGSASVSFVRSLAG
jgi:hypothetical protein